MIAKFKSKFQSENSKKISANFMYLSILQGMNLILPLITFPYLVRVLGIENFGLLMFAQAFIVYFTMIVYNKRRKRLKYEFERFIKKEATSRQDSTVQNWYLWRPF
jgi:Ca2+-dependent lipid-binding protein